MNRSRSAIFITLAFVWTLTLSVAYLPLMLRPRRIVQRYCKRWSRGLIFLARVVCGVRYRIDGMQNLPKGPAIVAAKHQSAWETFLLQTLLDDPVFVVKKELIDHVLVGRYVRKTGGIPVDRSAGLRALKPMIASARLRLAEGAQVIIFPEGTRVAADQHRPYQPGVAALYSRFPDVPVIPVAHNAGMFWRRWILSPGEVVVSILPALAPGLDRQAFMAELERQIEGETRRIAEAAVDNGILQTRGK